MIAQGHRYAYQYPLGRLWAEKEIAERRINKELANAATLNKAATTASFHGGKANNFFTGVIEKLVGK